MESNKESISFFQKYLTLWVFICMIIGILISKFLPIIPNTLNKFEYANVSIPIAILIWLMIYPMMMSVDFQSIKNVTKNPQGLFVTWIVNWIIKSFTMFFIASLFFLYYTQRFYTKRFSKRIFSWCCTFRSCSMYCYGICLECINKWKSIIYCSASCN